MNNEDNNLNAINPQPSDNIITITPVDNQNNNSTSDVLVSDDSNQENSNLIPVNPIGDMVQNDSNQAQDNVSSASPINQELSVVIPQMKNDSSSVNLSNSNTNSTLNDGGLQLNGSTPFDIGVSNNDSITKEVSNEKDNLNSNNTSTDISNQDTNINNDINPPAVSINSNSELTIGFYIKNMILFSIPIVGLILMIKKATNKDDKNESVFAKAYLILYAIVFGFFIVLWILFAIIGSTFIKSNTDNINYTTTILEDYNG